jgi:hypothetical protein
MKSSLPTILVMIKLEPLMGKKKKTSYSYCNIQKMQVENLTVTF